MATNAAQITVLPIASMISRMLGDDFVCAIMHNNVSPANAGMVATRLPARISKKLRSVIPIKRLAIDPIRLIRIHEKVDILMLIFMSTKYFRMKSKRVKKIIVAVSTLPPGHQDVF